MSDNMDKDIFNMNELDNLMNDMFDAGQPVNVINEELKKMGGSLELFSEDEAYRAKKVKEWEEDPHNYAADGSGPRPPAYQSSFDGTKTHNIAHQQNTINDDGIAFEKDEQNSSLAGVKTTGVSSGDSFWVPKEGISDGIEDIHDFFAVGHSQEEQKLVDTDAIDEQIKAMQNLSTDEKQELDQEFVNNMGMDIQRLRQMAGATSAWQEIRAIKLELEDLQTHSRKLLHRFEEFIDIYVQDKIPK